MAEKRVQRRLAAILAADVVGYSYLMGRDEAGTRARFNAHLQDLIEPAIANRQGRIVKTTGDALLVEFASVVDAVQCAVEIQNGMVERNADEPADRRIVFRIGVNLGDVIIEGDDIHGDGVNVAARLEGLADPGGVSVSGKVFEEVRGKLELVFADGGTQRLKNIDRPIAVYHLGGKAAGEPAPPTQPKGQKTGDLPKVAVASFKVLGGDDEIASLAESLCEVIIGGLTALSALSVTRADSDDKSADADFLLEGSIRAVGNKLRATFMLRDRVANAEVWSRRYDRTMDDLFDLEDDISQSVISVIRIRLKALEMERLESAENADLSVADLLSKAAGYFVRSPGDNEAVAEILAMALEKAPQNSMAHAMMALCRWRVLEFSPLAVDEAELAAIQDLVRHALRLDPKSYFALLIDAVVHQDLLGEDRDALVQAETALELNPNFTQAQATAGIAKCHLGDWENGYAMLVRAIEANKEDPHRFRHQRERALILSTAGRDDEAADIVRRLIQQAPDLCRNGVVSAAIYWQAGAEDSARHCIAELLTRYPDLSAETMRPIHLNDEASSARFRQALLAAGLPEE